MKKFLKLLALTSLFGLAACPGGGGDGNGNGNGNGNGGNAAANAQGAIFARDFGASNNSQPANVSAGDAGPVNPMGQPNNVN